MTNEPTIEFRDDHVHVELAPGQKFDPSSGDASWKKIKELCAAHDTHRVLIEGPVPAGEPDAAEVVAAGQRAAIVPRLWLALHFDDFVPDEQSELFEVIAASKGIRVKHFADREHALAWLRSNTPR